MSRLAQASRYATAWLKLNHETPEQFKLPFYADTPNGLLNVWRMEDEVHDVLCSENFKYFGERMLQNMKTTSLGRNGLLREKVVESVLRTWRSCSNK